MKLLLCILAFIAAPMLMLGQEQGSGGTGTDPTPVPQSKVTSEYTLEKQKVIEKPDVEGCTEDGIVVLTIEVNTKGEVVKATIARGTNASVCLIEKAKTAALATRFEPSTKEKQVGTVTYKFKVTE